MDADERERALALAYRILGARERTAGELRASLERRGYAPELIGSVQEELIADGLLDDARFARLFAEDRRLLDQWGSERIAQDLARRGVSRDAIEAAVGATSAEDEMDAALDLLSRRFSGEIEGDRDRDRAWRLLVRRGYEPELAYAAVRAHERGRAGRAA